MRKYLCFVLLFLATATTVGEAADRYVNRTAGFSVSKPSGWHYMTAQQNIENLKQVRMGSEEFKQQMLRHASVPLVVMTQHQEPYDGLNASFKANLRPFGELPMRDPKGLLGMILPAVQQQMQDAKLTAPVEQVDIDGRPAAHAVLEYVLRNAEGGEFPTVSEMWIVPAGEYFYILGAGYAQGDSQASEQIAGIVKSIDFDASAE